jgi:hypothetical protein
MPLLELQQNCLAHLRDEPSVFRESVVDAGRISVEQRLHIYHHAYRARLVEVLQDVFERTWAYLGDDNFADYALRFIAAHPPAARTLNDFGEAFPAWLDRLYPNDGEVAELAMIDWQLRRVFDGPNATSLGLADLAGIAGEVWATVGFMFHPALALEPITYNAASIWEALEHATTPPAPALLSAETFLAVWRRDLRPHFVTIDILEAAAIEKLRAGTSFAVTCDELQTRYPEENVVAKLGAALRRWVDDEMLVAIHPGI